MKLIELLVQELPKRGGWPDGVRNIEMFASGMIFFDGDCAPKEFNLPQCSDGWEKGMGRNYTNAVTREQYEAALAAAQQPVWNGEGLPPVGTECEFFDCEKWFKVTMMYGGSQLVVLFDHGNQIERTFSTSRIDGKFRPIRSEADKKRDKIAQMITDIFYTLDDDNNYLRGEGVYDAISAGKVPGLTIK